MRRSLNKRACRDSNVPADRAQTVCIVDPQFDDYQNWKPLAQAGGVRLLFVPSAEEALRLASTETIDLWVVNTALPGLSGCDLCGMLKSRSPRTAIYLVADCYTTATEQAAWRAKPTLFGCKGAHSDWFAQWVGHSVQQTSRHLKPGLPSAAVNP